MLADFSIPRLSNDMNINVQKNYLGGQILFLWYFHNSFMDAIFEDDENFKKVSDREIHYKIKSEDGDTNKNFLIEFNWPDEYPEVKPEITLNSFFNIHLTDDTKSSIIEKLDEEAENNIGKKIAAQEIFKVVSL